MDKNKDILSVSNSILVGAILIALSIFVSSYDGKAAAAKNPSDTRNAATAGSGNAAEVAERGDAPKAGGGKVTIVEFSDFQCPFCKSFVQEAYKNIKSKYIDTGKVKIIFRHLPLTSIHVNAQISAEAAECASRQGKFWEYHDVLFAKAQSDGTGLDANSLKSYANNLGLNTQKFNSCLDGGEAEEAVSEDLAAGREVGVTGTPTFFINGKKIVGAQPFGTFESAIEEALAN